MSLPLEDRVYAQLSGYAPLAALVGTRISPGLAEQGTIRPYVEFSLIGTPREYTQEAAVDMQDTVVQIDSWGDTYDDARAVNAQVNAALLQADSPPIGLYWFIENDGTDLYDYEARRYRVMAQARAWLRQ